MPEENAKKPLYTRVFDPDARRPKSGAPKVAALSPQAGDARRSLPYVYDDPDIVLAVNVALAAKRPLLVRGVSGTGKSALARSIADLGGWRYAETVVTSRTQARDLLYEVDLLRRLHDAQIRDVAFTDDFSPYIIPGVLWWAFNEKSARAQLERCRTKRQEPITGPAGRPAVILVDEIDKADPDTPNNLLVPFGSFQFDIPELGGEPVRLAADAKGEPLVPLLVITTNEERDLPPAFLRRCVELRIKLPGKERMKAIGRANVEIEAKVLNRVADAIYNDKGETKVSPAEFVDALRACRDLQIDVDSLDDDAKLPAFRELLNRTIWRGAAKDARK